MGFVNDFDIGSAFIGVIVGFEERPTSRTGYLVTMYLRGEERTLDVTEEAYQIRWTTKYFPYPVLGEIVFMLKFDDNGIVTEFVNVNDISEGKSPIKTGLVMGTCCMFKKPILPETPRFADIFTIEGDTITFKDFDRNRENGEIAHCVYGGAMEYPKDGASFKLAKDANVYVWDWSTAAVPFHRCTREEAASFNFVDRFHNGTTADILKHCYFINFYSTRGNENEIDFIKCFLNKGPGFVHDLADWDGVKES